MKSFILLDNTKDGELSSEFESDDVRYIQPLVRHFLEEFF